MPNIGGSHGAEVVRLTGDFSSEQISRFRSLVRLRVDGASMEEADFQRLVREEPGFREWLEQNGIS